MVDLVALEHKMKCKYGLVKKDNMYHLAETYGTDSYIINICEESYEKVMDTLRMILKDLEDPIIIDKDVENDNRTEH
jgi:hypothetical protein